MPIHKTIMPDGSIGYKWGTTGKAYKRIQDARNQEKAIYASGWHEKKDQKIKDVCPECGKEKCECKTEKKASYANVMALRKAASTAAQDAQNFIAIDKGPQYQFTPDDLFRIQHLKKLVGPGAVTTQNRLGYAKWAPTLLATLIGAGVGAAYGYGSSKDPDKTVDTTKGTAIGGGIGLLASLSAQGIGKLMGTLEDIPNEQLRQKIDTLGAMDYITRPYTGSYVQAQIDKDFDEWSASQKARRQRG